MTADKIVARVKAKEEANMAKLAQQKAKQAEKVRIGEEKVVQKYLAAERKRTKEQQKADRERALQQRRAEREAALGQRKAEHTLISRELKQMRQKEAATRALLRRRQREVEAAARKQMSMEDIDRKGLTRKARGRKRRPLQALDQNMLIQSDTVAIV